MRKAIELEAVLVTMEWCSAIKLACLRRGLKIDATWTRFLFLGHVAAHSLVGSANYIIVILVKKSLIL